MWPKLLIPLEAIGSSQRLKLFCILETFHVCFLGDLLLMAVCIYKDSNTTAVQTSWGPASISGSALDHRSTWLLFAYFSPFEIQLWILLRSGSQFISAPSGARTMLATYIFCTLFRRRQRDPPCVLFEPNLEGRTHCYFRAALPHFAIEQFL